MKKQNLYLKRWVGNEVEIYMVLELRDVLWGKTVNREVYYIQNKVSKSGRHIIMQVGST